MPIVLVVFGVFLGVVVPLFLAGPLGITWDRFTYLLVLAMVLAHWPFRAAAHRFIERKGLEKASLSAILTLPFQPQIAGFERFAALAISAFIGTAVFLVSFLSGLVICALLFKHG